MKRYFFRIILSIISILTITLIVLGQNNGNSQNTQNKLVDRFEKIIKNKEPRFKGGRSAIDVRKNRDSAYLKWKLHEDYIYVDVSDFSTLEESLTVMNNYLTENRPTRHRKTKLTNLGDEAYLELDKNYANIKLRKGKAVINISATNPNVAKRFARYFVREISCFDNCGCSITKPLAQLKKK